MIFEFRKAEQPIPRLMVKKGDKVLLVNGTHRELHNWMVTFGIPATMPEHLKNGNLIFNSKQAKELNLARAIRNVS